MASASFDSVPHAATERSMISFIAPMVHGAFSEVNGAFRSKFHTSCMDQIWQRVMSELGTRRDIAGREVAWLAERLKLTIQRVNNWKTRGVPPAAYVPLADALGWSVDELLGRQATPRPWPLGKRIPPEAWASLDSETQGALTWEFWQAYERVRSSDAKALAPPSEKQNRANGK